MSPRVRGVTRVRTVRTVVDGRRSVIACWLFLRCAPRTAAAPPRQARRGAARIKAPDAVNGAAQQSPPPHTCGRRGLGRRGLGRRGNVESGGIMAFRFCCRGTSTHTRQNDNQHNGDPPPPHDDTKEHWEPWCQERTPPALHASALLRCHWLRIFRVYGLHFRVPVTASDCTGL